jgi:hypothetical protein
MELRMALDIQKFTGGGPSASHPSCSVPVPQTFKIIGGGAAIDPVQPANFLTASFPADHRTWFAAGKDHKATSPASITAWAFGINDPNDLWEVKIVHVKSAPLDQPQIIAILPPGFVLTGGGAFVDYKGAGNMLTASFPHKSAAGLWDGWEAHSKDHQITDPAQLTAYAIGIRLKSGAPGVKNTVAPHFSNSAAAPTTSVPLPDGFTLTGGGAFDKFSGAGNMLTASGPDPSNGNVWKARGADHFVSSPAIIQVFAIGIAPS